MARTLTEALASSIFPPGYSSQGGRVEADWIDRIHRVFEAARRWAALDTAREIGWCETHKQRALGTRSCQWAVVSDALRVSGGLAGTYQAQCRIVPAVLDFLKGSADE
jgi:hypothetical protein